MIYKLDQMYLVDADKSGMNFICMSTTGLYFLAQSDSLPEGIESIEVYPDDHYQNLLEAEDWIQPTGDV